MADNTVRQVQTSEGLFDIEAPLLVPENSYEMRGLHIKSSGNESAMVKFNDTGEGTGGRIELNSKGNLALESLVKHVNLEAKKGIQLKPTTNIIFDSSRRILNEKGNEVHLQFVFDDYDESNTGHYPGDDEEYAQLKVEARNIDLRCFDHGGIALQPCGTDGDNKENKIKFESSRTSPLGTANPTYSKEGGQGLEFGTFNNEHSSLFTGDYRFNKDGMVYAATRETPVTIDGKTDYPTQIDDFKDVLDNKKCATWNDIIASGKERTLVISKSGNINAHNGMLVNNMHIPVYIDTTTGNLYLSEGSLDVVYDGNGNEVVFGDGWAKATVYVDQEHTTPVPPSSKLFLKDTNNEYWIADINSSSQLKEYGHKDHDKVVNMTVLSAEAIGTAGYPSIQPSKIYNVDENPVLNIIKNIVTDSSIDDYSKFVLALKSAFNWS